jgi:hypothetical protein
VIASLERELQAARVHVIAGDYTRAAAELASIGKRADVFAWPLLQAHVRTLVGRIQLERGEPANATLTDAAELALTNGFAREATDALAVAIEAAGNDHATDRITSLAALAQGTARNTHDRVLEVRVEIAVAKALVRSGQWQPGLASCRTASRREPGRRRERPRRGADWSSGHPCSTCSPRCNRCSIAGSPARRSLRCGLPDRGPSRHREGARRRGNVDARRARNAASRSASRHSETST